MTKHRQCDGYTRRDAIRVGALGATGLTLGGFLKLSHAGQTNPQTPTRNAIFIELPGGPSHIDTFDLKPDGKPEMRGPFQPIKTVVPGVEICEHLPKLAQQTTQFTILRGVSHSLGAHPLGQKFLFTGNRPTAALEYPAYGSVAAQQFEAEYDLPGYVAIPRASQGPGYLGVKNSALATNAVPVKGRPFNVRGISMAGGLSISELERRKNLLNDLDQTFAALESQHDLLGGLDEFSHKAFQMITSKRTRSAFDISREPESYHQLFADDPFSQSCLLATRLIESGIRFVTLNLGGWDTHQDNFTKLKDDLLPRLDNGLSGLFAGLQSKGLMESTTVFVTGEFGRTPKINSRSAEGGRDHYPRCMFMLMGGGAIRGGQVLGESDQNAEGPANEGFKPEDVAASFYQAIGIDPKQEFQTPTGRPVMIVREGNIIPELFK